jgi:hypothetical protein
LFRVDLWYLVVDSFAKENDVRVKESSWQDFVWSPNPKLYFEAVRNCVYFVQKLVVFFKRADARYFDDPASLPVEAAAPVPAKELTELSEVHVSGSTTPERDDESGSMQRLSGSYSAVHYTERQIGPVHKGGSNNGPCPASACAALPDSGSELDSPGFGPRGRPSQSGGSKSRQNMVFSSARLHGGNDANRFSLEDPYKWMSQVSSSKGMAVSRVVQPPEAKCPPIRLNSTDTQHSTRTLPYNHIFLGNGLKPITTSAIFPKLPFPPGLPSHVRSPGLNQSSPYSLFEGPLNSSALSASVLAAGFIETPASNENHAGNTPDDDDSILDITDLLRRLTE